MNSQSQTTPTPTTAPPKNRGLRRILMLGVPLAVILGSSALYLAGGRYVSTDNAYVKAAIASLSPEITGNVIAVLVSAQRRNRK